MNLNTETSWCFEPWISLRSRSKFLHDRSGGLSLSNDQFDLTESNVSNAIYTPGPCLRGGTDLPPALASFWNPGLDRVKSSVDNSWFIGNETVEE